MGFFNKVSLFSSSIYIDLGTANTIVALQGRGLVANEPSVVAYKDLGANRRIIIAVGNEAKSKIGKTHGDLVTSYPLKDGVIADLNATEEMLKYFLRFKKSGLIGRNLNLVISLPFGVSDVEKKALRDCGLAAGAKNITLIEEPMAAALGADLPVHQSGGCMILDIGGGTTEAAVISLNGIVHCEAVRVGGHSFDKLIVDFIRKKHNLRIGDQSAERLKISIGTVFPGDAQKSYAIRGIDYTTGLPRETTISSDEVFSALDPDIQLIINAAKLALENTPPEILSDLVEHGVVLAGGGALIHGMVERVSEELGIPARIASNPLTTIARGGLKAISEPALLEKIALN